MAKILTFFNHKGGVGKTTSAYNVASALSNIGKRVLMIDADSQCNLTEIALKDDFLYSDEGEEFLQKNNVYSYFVDYVQPLPGKQLPPIETVKVIENLEILPGYLRFAELEKTISLSVANIQGLSHIPTSAYEAFKRIGKDFDFIVLDLSPALSATNQLFLWLSDYFIVPANPSIFSRQALVNLKEVFKRWNGELAGFEVFLKYKSLPKMLGIICQNYRPFSRADEKNTKSAMRFEDMMKELNEHAVALARDLSGFGMALTEIEFNENFCNSTPYRIADIPDFNQLVRISEIEKKPVIALDNKLLSKHDLGIQHYRDKVGDFIREYSNVAKGVIKVAKTM